MAKLRIQPHGRLQEWVAHEKGYFEDQGLEYTFEPIKVGAPSVNVGAYELYEKGQGAKGEAQACDISSACHWAVSQAASGEIGRMWAHAYSVTPGAICVPRESTIHEPAQLAGVDIAVGYHSGSHFTALQSLEDFLKPEDSTFSSSLVFARSSIRRSWWASCFRRTSRSTTSSVS
jgi:NitT/TauT family transport system substrate-binding protein